jgi:carbonic anhydrase
VRLLIDSSAEAATIIFTVMPRNPRTPDAAIESLLSGNRRFTTEQMTAHEHDLTILKKHTSEKQEPFAAVLSCADSRVPVELVFDQTIGHLFVVRVAGNIMSPVVIASLEYAAAVLAVKAILVLGHGGCGAVKATIKGKAVPGQISTLFAAIHPAVDDVGPDMEAAVKANARFQAELLRKASTVVSSMLEEERLRVASGYYDLVSGTVSLLD